METELTYIKHGAQHAHTHPVFLRTYNMSVFVVCECVRACVRARVRERVVVLCVGFVLPAHLKRKKSTKKNETTETEGKTNFVFSTVLCYNCHSGERKPKPNQSLSPQ